MIPPIGTVVTLRSGYGGPGVVVNPSLIPGALTGYVVVYWEDTKRPAQHDPANLIWLPDLSTPEKVVDFITSDW